MELFPNIDIFKIMNEDLLIDIDSCLNEATDVNRYIDKPAIIIQLVK